MEFNTERSSESLRKLHVSERREYVQITYKTIFYKFHVDRMLTLLYYWVLNIGISMTGHKLSLSVTSCLVRSTWFSTVRCLIPGRKQ